MRPTNSQFLRKMKLVLIYSVLALLLCDSVLGIKECTNVPTQSHSLRFELLTSKNETLKTDDDGSDWERLMPRRFLREENDLDVINMRVKKSLGFFKVPEGILKDVSLHDVRLHGDTFHGQAQVTNLEYLLMLDVDRLLWSFRNTSGLASPGVPYGGWESPDTELRGHFVG